MATKVAAVFVGAAMAACTTPSDGTPLLEAAAGASQPLICSDPAGDVQQEIDAGDLPEPQGPLDRDVADLTDVAVQVTDSDIVIDLPTTSSVLDRLDRQVHGWYERPAGQWRSHYIFVVSLSRGDGVGTALSMGAGLSRTDGHSEDGWSASASPNSPDMWPVQKVDGTVDELADGRLRLRFDRAALPPVPVPGDGPPEVTASVTVFTHWFGPMLSVVDSRQVILHDTCGDARQVPTPPATAAPSASATRSPVPTGSPSCEGVSGCLHDNGIDFADLRADITAELTRQGRSVAEVNCDVGLAPPRTVPRDGTFTCEVYDGRQGGGTVEVTVLGDGRYDWELVTWSDVAG